ncbi:MAG TPA: hypothetical protein DCO72_03780 [Ruminococcus sp.]|nr:hypothetical protein [Ruminococcus sp.]
MSLKKQIKKAYNGVHAPEDLTERLKQELYQKDFEENSDFEEYQEETPQRPAFLKYLVYIAAMTAIGIGCVSALNYIEQFRTDFRPASRVNENPPVSDISEPPLTTFDENGENATVPDVVGYHFEYATKILNQCGFETEYVYEFSENVLSTNVISVTWNGEDVAEKSVPIGATLELHVSKGSQDSPETMPTT